MEQWAWEFLRRNKQYQDTWKRYRTGRNALLGIEPLPDLWVMFGVNELCDPNTEYNALPKNTFKFCHYILVNHITYRSKLHVDKPQGMISAEFVQATQPQEAQEVVIKFDVSKDIESQLEEARLFLEVERNILQANERKQFSPKSSHKDRFPTYLRLLDAETKLSSPTDRALSKQVAALLAKDEKNPAPDYPVYRRLEMQIKTARQMRDDGYRFLMLDKDRVRLARKMQLQDHNWIVKQTKKRRKK